jgi:putative peptidoglycan lipid II flippase
MAANASGIAAVLAMSSAFVAIDRYFASRLPQGSVSAISYASASVGLLTTLAASPMGYFLSRISRAASRDAAAARDMTLDAVALAMAYMAPMCAFLAAAARPLVSAMFGWGNFGAESVGMTSICLASYGLGVPFTFAAGLMYRYSMADGRMKTLIRITAAGLFINIALDWALVAGFGLLGLSLATSAAQFASFALYYKFMVDMRMASFLLQIKFFQQAALAAPMAGVVVLARPLGPAAGLVLSAALYGASLFLSERLGLMARVPPHWRPSGLARYLAGLAGALRG